MKGLFEKSARFVTDHNRIVVLVMLLLTAGVGSGVTQLQMGSTAGGGDAVGDTTVAQKQSYIQSHYAQRNDSGGRPAAVYVRDPDGNVLSKRSLLDSLRYQRAVRDNESVAAALPDRGGVVGVSNLVAKRLAGSQSASLADQISALESASESEVRATVKRTLSKGSPALDLLPKEYDPGTASATSRRMVFQFRSAGEGGDGGESGRRFAGTPATRALYEQADGVETHFTIGPHARTVSNEQFQQDLFELVLPAALVAILAVLAFSYRDLADVIVGFVGVVLSVVWMFGILGWLEIPAGVTLIIGPVLIVGLSVDYGLHVFMRYREERGEDEGIREPMTRALSSVAVAVGLVTVTTAVGFLSNVTNEFDLIKDLAVGITLGVASAFVIFVTVVPALKVSVDGLLERVGFDRRKQPLGKTRLLEPPLASGADLARKAAPVVIVLALVAGAASGLAWTELDRKAFQQGDGDVAEWKQDLPGPLAWETTAYDRDSEFVNERYRSPDESDRRTSQILVEGDVTDPRTLERLQSGRERAAESEAVFERAGEVPFVSPVTVMESVAARNDAFAETFREADTDGDGVPDRNLDAVYAALYDTAPERASRVVERTDGEFRSLRMVVPIQPDAKYETQADEMRAVAAAVESDGDALTATAVGPATVSEAESAQTADSILTTLVVALLAVFVMLMAVYRIAEGSATLGAITVVPIALVTAFVVGGMYLLDIPLTLFTSLLMSLVVGLGIDYNIHISDRFARELSRDGDAYRALREAVTGTGGALFGSTLTSTGAFSALLLAPSPQLRSFGALVVLALSLSFVVSIFVLPSLLSVWTRYVHATPEGASSPTGAPAGRQD
ncbi:MMPL family transporter [Halorussus gelatinilyticus]|uniref:MMPL family transporter n=1 Tax=Halorussus gelatinilyticus TaxID=2937524 RepID=A0A8U0IFR8_9EURY|nr:MMPL family transporter [Halorussus gelatinilyticus]UPV98898.1 MMPL family transporter [Halorussus gelatinilyticus]